MKNRPEVRESSYEIKTRKAHRRHFLKVTGHDFTKALKKVRPYTMLSRERLYDIYNSIDYIIKNRIPGEIVEIGCWGGGALGLCHYALRKNKESRQIYGYDTFEGHPKPSRVDKDIWGQSQIQRFNQHKTSRRGWAKITLQKVRKNLTAMGVKSRNIHLVKGKIEETAAKTYPKKIALLRIDVDWFEPTSHSLKFFYPKLSKKGVLIVDDYGHYQGCKEAVDSYFKKSKPRHVHIDYSCISITK
jgi:O-methyltransferase